MDRSLVDVRRLLLALGGFVGGIVLTSAFGLAGFIALMAVLLIGVPLFAVLAARRAAGKSTQ